MKRNFTVCNDKTRLKTPRFLAGGIMLLATFGNAKSAETSPQNPSSAINTWDMEALKRRGIISEQVENLDKLSELPEGTNFVDVNLNGDFKGSYQIQVNNQGIPCFTSEFFDFLGIVPPTKNKKNDCYDWPGEQPGTSVAWQSESQILSIVVPVSMLKQDNIGKYGGIGGHINYDYYSSINKTEYQKEHYSWVSLNNGINISNWMFRSQQNIQDFGGEVNTTFNSAYVERFFTGINKIFQAGEISTRNTLFALGRIRGVQFYPDDAFSRTSDSGVVIDGMANTPQARVEVRQYDQLIYSTLVAAGPFHLVNIPVQNLNAELHVSVVETSGETQQFIVPVTQLMGSYMPVNRGLSVAFGKLKNKSNDAKIPAILTLDKDWQPVEGISLRTGTLLSGKYQSIAAAMSGRLAAMPGQSFSLQALLVKDHFQNKNSGQIRFYSNHAVTKNISFSLGASKNSPGYANIEEASFRARQKRKSSGEYNTDDSELSLGLSWDGAELGAFSFTHSLSTNYPDHEHWRYFILNWTRRFNNGVQISTSASHAKGGNRSNKNININFSWPLGEKRFHHYYRSYNKRNVVGSDVNMPLGSGSDMQLAVEETTNDHNRSIQTSLSNNLHYTNLNMNVQWDNQHQRNYSISGNGSVVAHKKGITFSDSQIGDTYGVLSLSQPMAGVPVLTPAGTSWTDWRGMTVLPSLSPWSENFIDVDVDKLPKNIDITNGHRTLRPARGSVKFVQVAMLSGNRLLMTINLADGKPLPKGSTLWDGKKLVAEAVDEGLVFMTNAETEGSFRVKIAQSTNECDINYKLDQAHDEDSLYQQLTLVCK
ncbi:fimbria/pilus outer membrane usher protein [Pantoea coffeiphila]|nr:fimbria/pilus outer membrane usher protein [Pantoea coffeiphila]